MSEHARGGLSRGLSAIGFLGLTALLVLTRGALQLESILLLYVLLTVVVALLAGVTAALICAVAAVLTTNYYFVKPLHTLRIASRDDVVTLLVFVLVASLVSLAAELAARQRVRAAEAAAEARLLAEAAAAPAAEGDPQALLDAIRSSFGYTSVSLEREGSVLAQTGAVPPTDGRWIDLGGGFRLHVDSGERLGEDHPRLRRLAAAAKRAVESRELAEADRTRSALLAAVGHDLRTPIAGIAAAACGLATPDLAAPDHAALVQTIAEGAERLGSLVANLLDTSRLHAGVVAAQCVPISLEEVVPRALGDADADAVLEQLPWVLADPGMLERVLANLVENVRRHAPDSPAWELRAAVDPEHVRLALVDHGPGLGSLQREHIYAPFQQRDDSGSGGLGLGLSVARGFMDAMGGGLEATDTPGGGLTMTITLRRAP